MRTPFRLALAVGLVARPLAAIAEATVSVEPVTLLENGQIAGCGLSSKANDKGRSVFADVIAFREGDRTAFAVRARPAENATGISAVRLSTASHDTAKLFPPVRNLPEGLVEVRTVLEGFTGSSFAQELMVMGGRFEVTMTDGATLAFDLPRPMPHRIRQAYLNCAGDLFRPEAD